MAQFVVLRPDQGSPSPVGGVATTVGRVQRRAESLKRLFTVLNRGEQETARTFARKKAALRNFERRLPTLGIGGTLVFKGRNDSINVRRVEPPSVTLPDQLRQSYVPQVQRDIYVFIMSNFDGVRWAGTCYCRDSHTGGGLSDHACCKAGDFFPKSKAQGDDIERAVKQRFGDKILYIAWQVALHYNHLHISTGRCSSCF